MPYFEIIGFLKKTTRKQIKHYVAIDDQQAKMLAEDDGIIPQSISLIPPKPATEKQITYARDLGLSFPSDINISEMSHLISRKVDDDIVVPAWFYDYAISQFPEQQGIGISKYIGLRALLDYFGQQYNDRKDTNSLIRLFIYSVTNELKNSRWQTPFNQLISDDIISTIVEDLTRDSKVVSSIKKYSVSSFIFFGEETDKEGYWKSGGSRRTIAFRSVAEQLAKFRVITHQSIAKPTDTRSPKQSVSSARKSGCLLLVISFITTISIFIVILF